MALRHCSSEKDYRSALTESGSKPVFFLKHSVACGISARARSEFEKFSEERADVACWEMVVQEMRDLSALIAEETGIRHESPQAFLFHQSEVVWSASHWNIEGESLKAALSSLA